MRQGLILLMKTAMNPEREALAVKTAPNPKNQDPPPGDDSWLRLTDWNSNTEV